MEFSKINPETATRRVFMGAALAGAASYSKVMGANDRIRIAGIGTGGRGSLLLRNARRDPNVELVAVCDVHEDQRRNAKRGVDAATEHVDYREVLDRKDVDAVFIATPDHWHVPITIDAIRAGKDVYVEKPVTHTLAEEAPLLKAVQSSKCVVQTGTQQRSWEHYVVAKRDVIDAGVLGQLTFIRTYWYQNHNKPVADLHIDPAKINWKQFLGPVSNRPFDADQYANWRWYWDFGGGAMTDLFIHWVDVAHWFLGDDKPLRATANGVKALLQQRQTPDTMSAALSYKSAIIEFDCALLGYIEGGGIMFRGTKGAMRLHRSGFEVYNEIPNYNEAFTSPTPTMKLNSKEDGVIAHVNNFLECMRTRKTPNAPIEAGIAAAHAGHVANLALRGGGVWTA